MKTQKSARSFFERVRMEGQPVANPASVVTSGQARFTVLTARLIRLEWSETGQFEDRSSFAFPTRFAAEPPAFTVENGPEWLVINTGPLTLRYRLDSGVFTGANLSISFELNSQPSTWVPGSPNPQNLRGTRRTLDECLGDATLDEGLLSRAGWSLFDDSQNVLFNSEDGWVAPRPDHTLQDWYFFGYGHDYKAALGDYTRFGGAVPLIPRFVLGSWWSRFWAYSAQDLKNIVSDFAGHDLPLDVLVLDMDWHTPDTWTGYTWNRELFPDPPGFLKWVHEHGLRTTLNLHPADGVQHFEEVYPGFSKVMGVDPASRQPIPFRMTDKRYVQHYFELLHHPLEDYGVDFWWMDWQQGFTSEMKGLDPLPWLNHLHFEDSTRRGLRAMLYSRWGKLGNHRYHIGFSGDTYVTWDALQFQPYFTATASNVLYGWWSHDIGGHMGGATEPELFARWVQFGALSPCLRLHSTKDPLAERRPWMFSNEIFRASRAAFHLRYQLVPFLYTLAREAADTGLALCRPMYYEYPEEEAAYLARYQYYLGDQAIAAPIVHPADPLTGLAHTDVWLPEGDWIDFFTRESFTGPRWVRIIGDLERIPFFVKAGAIIPQAEIASTTDALARDKLILRVFPGKQGRFRFYEDDGTTEAYHVQNEYEWTEINFESDSNYGCRLTIGAVEGHCPVLPTQRSYQIYFEGQFLPSQVLINGQVSEDWFFNDNATVVNIPKQPKNQSLTIELETDHSLDLLSDGSNLYIESDLRRLLQAHYPEVELSRLPAVILALPENMPGRADAIARLGGPLVHFQEYLTPEEAGRYLGAVVVGGPTDGSSFKTEVKWKLYQKGQVEAFNNWMESKGGGHAFYNPFSIEGKAGPTKYWTADVTVTWRGATLNYHYQSKSLFAAITPWQITVYSEKEQSVAYEQLFEADGQLNPALDWETYHQELSSVKNISDPYHVRLRGRYTPLMLAGEPLVGYAVTNIVSPDEREVELHFRTGGPIKLWLNGQLIKERTRIETSPVYPKQLHPHSTGPLRLKRGANRLVVETRPPLPQPFWTFSVAPVSLDGTLLTDLSFE